jgi:WD40 repeat protein
VYLYSTYDEPETNPIIRASIVPSNKKEAFDVRATAANARHTTDALSIDIEMADDVVERSLWSAAEQLLGDDVLGDNAHEESDNDEDEDEEGERGGGTFGSDIHSDVSVVLPRSRFIGHCNVATVKDGQFYFTIAVLELNLCASVNFLGSSDEYVTSGSDDGNFFIWRKATGKLHEILEGDGTVVNVIESHPHFPLIAVSGIDTTVKVQSVLLPLLFRLTFWKLFAPARGPSRFSRLDNMVSITNRNAHAARRTARRLDTTLAQFILTFNQARRALRQNGADNEESEDPSQCPNQ